MLKKPSTWPSEYPFKRKYREWPPELKAHSPKDSKAEDLKLCTYQCSLICDIQFELEILYVFYMSLII
jgi:hypothetical protein